LGQRLLHPLADFLDADPHQRRHVLIALLAALREQPEHRLLVVGQRHGSGSLRERAGG
jgi:hypothetical protein